MSDAPLDDPNYEPKNPPVNGLVPDVVEKFSKETQLRWFRRFIPVLGVKVKWERYYVTSEYHKGACCGSCEYESVESELNVKGFGYCCCQDERIFEEKS